MSQSTSIALSARLPQPQGTNITAPQWRVLCEAIFPGAKTSGAIQLALDYCAARKLDPFKRPVHIVPMYSKLLKREVETVWPGINELQVTASRTGQWAGMDEPRWGPMIRKTFLSEYENQDGTKTKKEIVLEFPEWCAVTVYRMLAGERHGFTEPVYWLESYARVGRSEMPNEMWAKRVRGQLHKCFSPDTEVLTDQGFQLFGEVTGNVMQATDHGLEPVAARPFKQEWFGPMIEAHGTTLDFSVTPNHDMVTTVGKIEAGAMYETATSMVKYRIPLRAPTSDVDAVVSDRALELAALYLTDGYDRPGDAFEVSVSRPRKIAKIIEIGGRQPSYTRACAGDVAVLGEQVITTRSDREVFRFRLAEIMGLVHRGKRPNMAFISTLSGRQAAILVDAMTFYDGNVTDNGTARFYSSHPRIIAAYELAVVLAGRSVSGRVPRVAPTNQVNWQVTVGRKSDVGVLRFSESQSVQRSGKNHAGLTMAEVNSSGEVWCVTVPSGQIVVRRRGQSMVCGNCAKAASLRAAFPEEVGNDYASEEMEGKDIEAGGVTIQGTAVSMADPIEQETESEVKWPNLFEKDSARWMTNLGDALAAATAEQIAEIAEVSTVVEALQKAPPAIKAQIKTLFSGARARIADVQAKGRSPDEFLASLKSNLDAAADADAVDAILADAEVQSAQDKYRGQHKKDLDFMIAAALDRTKVTEPSGDLLDAAG